MSVAPVCRLDHLVHRAAGVPGDQLEVLAVVVHRQLDAARVAVPARGRGVDPLEQRPDRGQGLARARGRHQHRPGRGDDVDDAGQLAARQGVAQGGADRVHGGEPVEVDEQRLGTDGPDVHGRGGAQPTTRCSRADVCGCIGWPSMARSST